MGQILTIAAHDIRLLLRDKAGFFFTVVFPLLMAVLFGAMYGGSGETGTFAVSVVDSDGSKESQAIIEALKKSPSLVIDKVSRADATESVRHGKRSAFIEIPKGFGESQRQFFSDNPPPVVIAVDPSRKAERGMIEGILTEKLFTSLQERFTDTASARNLVKEQLANMKEDSKPFLAQFMGDLDSFLIAMDEDAAQGKNAGQSEVTWNPVNIKTEAVVPELSAPPNAFAVSFPQAMAWALMMCAMALAMAFVQERNQGILTRLSIAPLSKSTLLAGKGLGCLTWALAVQVGLLGVGRLFFHMLIPSPVMLGIAVLASSLCFVGIMMLFSVMGKTEKSSSGMAQTTMIIMMMLGGGMIPLFAMPSWMKTFSQVSPVRWAILSIEGGLWRGFTPSEMAVPIAVLLGAGAVSFVVGARLSRNL